jgi:PAS domain S-box-containing protein
MHLADFQIFEALGSLVIVLEPGGKIVYWNRACSRLFGFDSDELRCEHVWELLSAPEEVAALKESFARLPSNEQPVRLENHWATAAGEPRLVAWSLSAVAGASRDAEWVVMSGIDIAMGERTGDPARPTREARDAEREQQLMQSNANRHWLQAVLDTAPLGIILFEPGGTMSFNPRAEELFGISLSPTGGSSQYAGRILFPNGTPVPRERLASARVLGSGETVVGEEYLIERPDGSRVPILGSAAPIRDGEGRVTGGVGVFQDISERMRAVEVIRKNERLLDGIFDLLPVGVWIADETGRIVRTNPAGLRVWAGARYVGVEQFGEYKAWWADTGELITADQWALARALTKGETSIGELIRIQCFDGTFKTIINSALPLHDEQGKFAGAIVVNEDVTGLKEIEEALRRAVRAHEEVLGIVAHDLRNPLNTILLQLQLLARPGKELEPCEPKALQRIRATAMRMNRLIQDLLDVVRIDGRSLSHEPVWLSAQSLLADLLEAQQKAVSEAGMALRLEIRGELPDIWADHDRLLQVLENLIGNAIKFAGPGTDVRVGAAPRGSEVLFWVADSGAGIPAEDLPHLFDRFWQARKTDKRGAGLGLAIVKGIVEAHGGRVWVESQAGVGTTFFFTMPVAAASADQPHVARGHG